MHLRGLGACGKLLKFTVMDGKVGAEVTAELEGLQAAVGGQWGASETGCWLCQDS